MALLKLNSNNPNFSFAIAKNPATGMLARNLHRGTLFGYFANDNTYVAFFKDSPNEVSYKSYKDEHFEYMNVTKYNSAFFPLDVVSEFFNSTLKNNSIDVIEYDKEGFDNEIEINLVRFETEKYIEIFAKFLKSFEIIATKKTHQNYHIKIKTKKTLRELLSCTVLFMVFNIVKNRSDYMPINEDQLVKYLACLGRLEVPYYIKYIFKVNLIRSPKLLKQYQQALETSSKEKIEMEFGSTNEQRYAAISKRLSFEKPICEIGCGEGNQTIKIAARLDKEGMPVYAVDPDEICRGKVKRRANAKELKNVKILESFERLKETYQHETKAEVLMVEVIEHMELAEASKLLIDVLRWSQNKATKLIITTPNYEFNKFYTLKGFRHEDHKFEFNEHDFKAWVAANINGRVPQDQYEFFSIGDKVNNIPTTLGVAINFNRESSI